MMGKTKKTKHGEDIPLTKKIDMPRDLAERGKAIKRKALNRAKDRESLESIKEYVYREDSPY
jgi:hypothetical protein